MRFRIDRACEGFTPRSISYFHFSFFFNRVCKLISMKCEGSEPHEFRPLVWVLLSTEKGDWYVVTVVEPP
jgi:hypothetical protein